MLLSSIRQSSTDDEHEDQPERALRNVVLVDVNAVFKAKPVATILTSLVGTSSQRPALHLETMFTLLETKAHEVSVLKIFEDSGGIRILSLALSLIEWKDENKFRLTNLLRKLMLRDKLGRQMKPSTPEHDDATREALTNALSELLSPIGTDQRVKDEGSMIVRTLCAQPSYHNVLSPVVC